MDTRSSSLLLLMLSAVSLPAEAGRPSAFSEQLSLLRAHTTVDAGGLLVVTGQDEIELHTAAWGRQGALTQEEPADPVEGACPPRRYRMETVLCAPTFERRISGGVERWSLGAVIEQSWTLEERPTGGGPLWIEVEVGGASLALEDEVAVLTTPSGEQWTYGQLHAWDALGIPLEAWLEVEGAFIRVVVDDTDAHWPIEIDPVLSAASQTLTVASADFGISVSMGDFNKDARTDLLVGARFGVGLYGQAFAFLGGASALNTTPSTTLTGADYYGKFGETLSCRGDVNGDGYGDALISEFYSERIFVYRGGASGLATTASQSISGEYGFGRRADIVGDFNKDGYADAVVASQDVHVYFYKGSSTGLNTTPVHTVTLPAAVGEVSGVGDTNGDGYDEVAYCNTSGGSVTVIRGAASFPGAATTLTVSGMSKLCTALGRAGDLNGDGYADLIVSDAEYSGRTGRVAIFYGGSSGLSSGRVWQIAAPVAGSGFGASVSGAGDINGDGYDDVVVGDDYDHTKVYVFHGSASGPVAPAASVIDSDSTTFGYALTGGRDLNRDGYDDIAIGDFGAGKVYLFYGCPDPDHDGYCQDLDCDDSNAAVKPGAQEICDGIDNDCDSQIDDADSSTSAASKTTWYRDADNDGYGNSSTTQVACAKPTGYVETVGDCDDSNAAVKPEAEEICDGIDNDCDGQIDDADSSTSAASKTTWYLDADNDGYGTSTVTQAACAEPGGYVETAGDCDDSNAAVKPGAQEVCDGLDNDCDAALDDQDNSVDPNTEATWYRDGDGDGYGLSGDSQTGCGQPSGYVDQADDCDDGAALISPAAQEICDGIDNDCDDQIDDADVSVSVSSQATFYQDADGDGFGVSEASVGACEQPAGYAGAGGDCDDSSAAVKPDAEEICDSIDNDCDGLEDDQDPSLDASTQPTWYEDGDGDGYGGSSGSILSCAQPEGYVLQGGDCDDDHPELNPGAEEVCDGVDNDCDDQSEDADPSLDPSTEFSWYEDRDGDGYGDASSPIRSGCSRPDGYASEPGDCDDDAPEVNPAAQELCDEGGVDEDCDGESNDEDDSTDADSMSTWYQDADGDGFGDQAHSALACAAPEGYSSSAGDCDDAGGASYPGAEERCDGVDGDCDGAVPEAEGDVDGDGIPDCADDCVDPGGEDSDGDGVTDSCEESASPTPDPGAGGCGCHAQSQRGIGDSQLGVGVAGLVLLLRKVKRRSSRALRAAGAVPPLPPCPSRAPAAGGPSPTGS